MGEHMHRTVTVLGVLALVMVAGLPVGAQPGAAGEALAEVDGQAITVEEVDRAIGAPLAKLQEQVYALRRQKLEALIAERLLANEATRRGTSVPALLGAEVTSKVRLVTEQEIEAFDQSNKAHLTGDEAALREAVIAERRERIIRELAHPVPRRPNLEYPVTNGIQTRSLRELRR